MMDYARRMVGSDTMDEEKLGQIREQQEVCLKINSPKFGYLKSLL